MSKGIVIKLIVAIVGLQLILTAHANGDYYEHEDYEPVTPCKKHRPGDPDLTTYDIISSFRFDEFHARNEGVQQIIGSTGYQTAYHLEEYSNMTVESVQAFPKGVPHEFSFECTFRVPQQQPRNEWYLFELTNYLYESQMSVTINPTFNTIGFSVPKYDGLLQTISFKETEIFDRSWHKLMFGITQDSVRLWVDCKPVPDLNGHLRPSLEVRGPVDATNGAFSIAQDCRTKSTVPIDVQWMIFSCDAEKPARSNCQDLPLRPANIFEVEQPIIPMPMTPPSVVPIATDNLSPFEASTTWRPIQTDIKFEQSSTHRPWLLSSTPIALTRPEDVHALVCPDQCPAGPPGLPGPIGSPGERGLPGLNGLKGAPGIPGPPGVAAVLTNTSPKGDKGSPGLPGLRGLPGMAGEAGPAGPPGLPGLPGTTTIIREPIGPTTDQQRTTTEATSFPQHATLNADEVREICMVIVKEYITEYASALTGPPGARGAPGRRGSTGPQGIPGEQGLRGSAGERGLPGLMGHKGPPGDIGPAGLEGQKGDRGEDGYGREGPQGPEGPAGLPGHGHPGPPGRPGDPGPQGAQGMQGERGPPGAPGICPDCSAQTAQYAYPLLLAQQQYSNKGPQAYYSNKGPQDYNRKG